MSTTGGWRRTACDRLTGRGVYYGGSRSEGLSCRDEHVVVVGGGNSAGQAAVYFAGYARG